MSGGAYRDRTDDPLLAKQVLSQLSYGPCGKDDWPPVSAEPFPDSPLAWLPDTDGGGSGWI